MKLAAVFLFLLAAAPAAAGAADAATANTFKARAMAALGYDDNPRLDSERKGDAFAQESVSLDWKRRLDRRLRVRAAYDVFNLNYSSVTDQSVLYQALNPGLDYLLTPSTALQVDYRFEYVYFPRNSASSFRAHGVRAGLLRKLSDSVRVRAGVTPSSRQFTGNKIREADGAESAGEDRTDSRWASDAEVVVDAWKGATLRAGLAYTRNDSDDFFNDFYDYDSWAFRVALAAKLSARVSGFARLGYENLAYDSRPTVAGTAIEDSDVYTASLNLLYELRKNVSVGLGHSYRRKESNEPSQAYSASVSTLGLYYAF